MSAGSSWNCVRVFSFSFNSVNLDPRLPEESGPEPGRKDELRGGEAATPDDQHRPERAVRPLFVQGQGQVIAPVIIFTSGPPSLSLPQMNLLLLLNPVSRSGSPENTAGCG